MKTICIILAVLFSIITCDNPERNTYNAEIVNEEHTGIEISIPSRTLYIGEEISASLLVLRPSGEKVLAENSDVSWLSSDLNIFKVDENGLVTALHEGTASIIGAMGNSFTSEDIHIGDYTKILISEVLYNENENEEFIEIYNGNNCNCDISGFGLIDGTASNTKFIFPDGSLLSPQSFIIIAHSFNGFCEYFGFCPDYSPFSYSLNKDGEAVILERPDYSNYDCVYIEKGTDEWPVNEDTWGSSELSSAEDGDSIQRIDYNDSDTYLDWESGKPTPGF